MKLEPLQVGKGLLGIGLDVRNRFFVDPDLVHYPQKSILICAPFELGLTSAETGMRRLSRHYLLAQGFAGAERV